jgi:hypothetical protein
MKPFYKNEKYKVMTKDGGLILNRSKILREWSRRTSEQAAINKIPFDNG